MEVDNALINECHATVGASNVINLIAKHVVRYKLSRDAKFATSPIYIKDKAYDFSLDLAYISLVDKEPFYGTDSESVVEHVNELSTLSNLFSDDTKKRTYFVTKIFPFSLKGEAKTWYNNLSLVPLIVLWT